MNLQKSYNLGSHSSVHQNKNNIGNKLNNLPNNLSNNPPINLSNNISKLKYVSPENSNISRSQSVMLQNNLQNMTLPKPGKSGSRNNFYEYNLRTESAFKHFGEDIKVNDKIMVPDFKKNFKAEIDEDEIIIEADNTNYRMNNQLPVQNLHQNLHQSSPDISSLISTHSNSSSIETTPSSQIPMSASRQNSTNQQEDVKQQNNNKPQDSNDIQVQQKVLRLQRDQQQQINQIRDANCVGPSNIQSSTATLDAIPDCIQFQEHRYVQAKNTSQNQLHQRKRWSQALKEKTDVQNTMQSLQSPQRQQNVQNPMQIHQNLQNPQFSTLNQQIMLQNAQFTQNPRIGQNLSQDQQFSSYPLNHSIANLYQSESDNYYTLPNMRTPKPERSGKLSKVSASYSNHGVINSKMDQHRRLLQSHSSAVQLNTGNNASQQQHSDVIHESKKNNVENKR